MKALWIALIVIVVVVLMIGGWLINGLNHVVRLDEAVNSAWAQIDNQLQRRNDLIPNLVNTVKGYAAQEKDVFLKVTELRSQWGKADTQAEKMENANQMSGALGRLLLVAENYPQLKSNQNFLALQSQLEGTENRIAVERMRYNRDVKVFNAYRRTVFGSIFASMRGLTQPREYFEVDESVKAVPAVKF
ncbi:MAG: LemA family protein [Candidatus Omnitrophica bacterium]|nr:LemA family protein [Candidatus Omnitrophota bacterium]MBU1851899.1 LemA family protein [Candidatus Omnitrophota bacterium]